MLPSNHRDALTVLRATPEDLADVRRILRAHDLPIDGVDEHVDSMLVARLEGRVVAVAALEVYPDGALLRSVAVDPPFRGKGIGQQMTNAALSLARNCGVDAVFLLTTTAAGFFPRFGFEAATRQEVPASLRSSVEFRSACPASATVMRVLLNCHSDLPLHD